LILEEKSNPKNMFSAHYSTHCYSPTRRNQTPISYWLVYFFGERKNIEGFKPWT